MPSVLEAVSTYSEILVEHAQSKKIFYLAHAVSGMTFDSFRLRAAPVTGGVGILRRKAVSNIPLRAVECGPSLTLYILMRDTGRSQTASILNVGSAHRMIPWTRSKVHGRPFEFGPGNCIGQEFITDWNKSGVGLDTSEIWFPCSIWRMGPDARGKWPPKTVYGDTAYEAMDTNSSGSGAGFPCRVTLING